MSKRRLMLLLLVVMMMKGNGGWRVGGRAPGWAWGVLMLPDAAALRSADTYVLYLGGSSV